jgi:nitroimidazol reductase NimA-like FMN-containing flavoprotein (pyridoxamine 5'-phosphate oxidase superfamily)
MRKEIHRMDHAEAMRLLDRVRYVHVAGTDATGRPVLRAVHGVVCGDWLAFHAAPAGEKMEILGREAVVVAEEIVCEIPSWFLDPDRACPATTYYRSAMAHGILEAVTDPRFKAEVLDRLMKKMQPEGGHVPIGSGHPLYDKAIAGLLVARIALDRVDGKSKLGQNRRPDERAVVLERLWQRGDPGDLVAIELVRQANPTTPVPSFLEAPEGVRLVCYLDAADVPEAARLHATRAGGESAVARRLRAAQAWVGARDTVTGELVASAAASGDGDDVAWVTDSAASAPAPALRAAVARLLRDHPAVRGARQWIERPRTSADSAAAASKSTTGDIFGSAIRSANAEAAIASASPSCTEMRSKA